MRHALKKNWTAKILALLLAVAIWFLIKGLQEAERSRDGMPSRGSLLPQ